jgi:hypothetical protein
MHDWENEDPMTTKTKIIQVNVIEVESLFVPGDEFVDEFGLTWQVSHLIPYKGSYDYLCLSVKRITRQTSGAKKFQTRFSRFYVESHSLSKKSHLRCRICDSVIVDGFGVRRGRSDGPTHTDLNDCGKGSLVSTFYNGIHQDNGHVKPLRNAALAYQKLHKKIFRK